MKEFLVLEKQVNIEKGVEILCFAVEQGWFVVEHVVGEVGEVRKECAWLTECCVYLDHWSLKYGRMVELLQVLTVGYEIVEGNRQEKYVLILLAFHLILEQKSRQLVRNINWKLEDYLSLLVIGDVIEFLCLLAEGNCGICKDVPSKIVHILERRNKDDQLGGTVRY